MKLFRRSSRRRTECCPPGPASFGTFDSRWHYRWHYFTRWLRPSVDTVPEEARQAFELALHGLPGDEAEKLRVRVRSAPGLRELWHLRSAVFGLVARHGSQSEAQRRMAALDRLFTTRLRAGGQARAKRV
ncbi:hypothetical protein [Azohydromonas lata]|uniref:hypothetical protein n=1 Tax=Azohydromonas lata TaxID=45677 RepID=UPI0008315E84|nr:hypothetical protein [Azohydromonas lata]